MLAYPKAITRYCLLLVNLLLSGLAKNMSGDISPTIRTDSRIRRAEFLFCNVAAYCPGSKQSKWPSMVQSMNRPAAFNCESPSDRLLGFFLRFLGTGSRFLGFWSSTLVVCSGDALISSGEAEGPIDGLNGRPKWRLPSPSASPLKICLQRQQVSASCSTVWAG